VRVVDCQMPQELIQKYGPEPNRYYMRYIEALCVIRMNLAVLVVLDCYYLKGEI
jgi:hypothetical protein